MIAHTDSENEDYSNEAICEELLDVNKIILVEQSRKLKSLSDEKRQFVDQINSMEKKNQREHTKMVRRMGFGSAGMIMVKNKVK